MVRSDNIAKTKQSAKLTPFQEELIKALKKVNEFKESCEANIVAIIYKQPEILYNYNLKLEEFSNNIWRVYWQISNDLLFIENKTVLDEITVGLYLEKHSKLSDKYNEYGGFQTIVNAGEYVQSENFEGYVQELRKWNAVLRIGKKGFAIQEKISEFADMTAEDIYNEYEIFLNDAFLNVESEVKSYNGLDGLYDLINKLDKGESVGLPLYNADILSKEIGGVNLNGNIYGLGANSGVGKSTKAIEYLFPSVLKHQEKIVYIINEQDESNFRKEALIWTCSNVLNKPIHKYILRDGKFNDETKQTLCEAAEWLDKQKENKNITIIPLEQYLVKTVIKIIKKYSSLGVRLFVLDTLKESLDSRDEATWKSMERDMQDLYDTVKPAGCNVGLFVTYQLSKSSGKTRHLANFDIGQGRSIVDVMSVNLMMRRPFEDEYEGGKNEITCYRLEGKNGKTKIPFKLSRDKKYMITFIPKNRFGQTDSFQIISEDDMSINIYKDIGICNVPEDW